MLTNLPLTSNALIKYTCDVHVLSGRTFYRVSLQTSSGRRTLSHTIQLQGEANEFNLNNLVNPFSSSLLFDVTVGGGGKLDVVFMDPKGQQVKRKRVALYVGVNNTTMDDVIHYPPESIFYKYSTKQNHYKKSGEEIGSVKSEV